MAQGQRHEHHGSPAQLKVGDVMVKKWPEKAGSKGQATTGAFRK
jgi:hypothetical protein